MIDGAAFEHELETADRRRCETRNVIADSCVIRQIVLAAPAVGFEPQRHGALVTTREDGAGIAQPDVAVLCRNDLGRVANGRASRGFGLIAVRKQPHVVARRVQRSDERRHVATRRFKIAVPLFGVCRPGRPNRLLRRPLGGNDDAGIGKNGFHRAYIGRSPVFANKRLGARAARKCRPCRSDQDVAINFCLAGPASSAAAH